MIKMIQYKYLFNLMLVWSMSCIGMEFPVAKYSYALAPPRPGEIEDLKKRGVLESRIEYAKEVGNHKIDDHLLNRAIANLKRSSLRSKGISLNEVDNIAPLPAPPPGWSGMPTKGNINIFALLIDFNDYPHVNSKENIHNKIFGEGDPANFPYESLKNYYSRSSYGLLNFTEGATLGWYRYSGNRSEVEQNVGRDNLIKQALKYFSSQGHDFSQYDNDGDGYIDYFIVLWAGPDEGFGSFWWAFLQGFSDNNFILNGKKLRRYAWVWEYQKGDPLDIQVVLHETGHGLGIPDYYDYNFAVGPDGGVGGLDMMDRNLGDHNSFSKWVLGWINPTLVSNGVQSLTLNPSGTSQDAVIIWPGVAEDGIFNELFVVQNRYRTGNDAAYPNDGLLIWHVDTSLNYNGGYLYDNSFTDHKLLRLMEADGLEEIDGDNWGYAGNAGDYYISGNILGPCTAPSSKGYNGGDSYVKISNILLVGQQISAVFDANSAEACGRSLVVNKSGNGTGGVVSSGRVCTNYPCSWRYGQGIMVTLAPVEDPGSSFGEWSGCDFINGKKCYLTLDTDREVTISFNYTSKYGRISGRVTDGRNGIPNVSVFIHRRDNSQADYVFTNSEGNYVTNDLAVAGDLTDNYWIYFNGQKMGHNSIFFNGKNSLSQADIVPVSSPNITQNINSTLAKLGSTISGCIRTKGGAEVSGVIMSGLPNTTSTDADGCYYNLIPVPPGWSGDVTPIKAGYMFGPLSKSYSNVASNQTAQDYVATEMFQDLLPGYWAYDYIIGIYNAGVTAGCSNEPLMYCPEEFVTREQMAVFIIRALKEVPVDGYCGGENPFSDVGFDRWSCKYIKRLEELGITTGYSDGRFGVTDNVTREQMAVFLTRALDEVPADGYCAKASPFTDVPYSWWSCKYVRRLAELAITTGYGNGRFGPSDLVTRAQMAIFLSRAFLGM